MLTDKVKRTINRYQMLEPHDSLIVAVSGGPDSIALLYVLNSLKDSLGLSLRVAHLNHRLRDKEADSDETFVKDLAGELGLQCIAERADVRQYAEKNHLNLEEAGRIARSRFLQDVASRTNANKIALGHTLNDQAETIIMRLIRGSGLDGLSAIRPTVSLPNQKQVIRPLIEISRSEIIKYLNDASIQYRIDSSNENFDFQRNRIRGELIPYLTKHFNPNLVKTLARYATLAEEESRLLDGIARRATDEIFQVHGPDYRVQISDILKHPRAIQRRIIREILRRVKGNLRRIKFSQIESILHLTKPQMSGKEASLPARITVKREFDFLIFLNAEQECSSYFEYKLSIPGVTEIKEANCSVETRIIDAQAKPRTSEPNSFQVNLDISLLRNGLVVRNRLPGDRYRVGERSIEKLKVLMIENKIPKSSRQRIPVFVSNSEVVWAAGVPLANIYKPRAEAGRYVEITVRGLKISGS